MSVATAVTTGSRFDLIKQVTDAFDRAGVEHVVLHAYDGGSVGKDSDLDLVVGRQSLWTADAIVRSGTGRLLHDSTTTSPGVGTTSSNPKSQADASKREWEFKRAAAWPSWRNTIVVVTSDHASSTGGNTSRSASHRAFRIGQCPG